MMKSSLASTGLLLALTACDPIHGLASRTTLHEPVDTRCVQAALASLPEAGHVTYRRGERDSVQILPKQRKVHVVTHAWQYGEAQGSILQINQTPDGWEFTNTRSRIGQAIPQAELDRFIPVMRKVNRALQDRCRLAVADLQAEPTAGM